MIRDRGSVKWVSMMLPEHVKGLRQWYSSDNDVREPEYDEFSLNAIADEINIAYKAKSNVRISYWNNKRAKEYEGQIVELLPNDQSIKIKVNDYNVKLHLKHIIKLNVYD